MINFQQQRLSFDIKSYDKCFQQDISSHHKMQASATLKRNWCLFQIYSVISLNKKVIIPIKALLAFRQNIWVYDDIIESSTLSRPFQWSIVMQIPLRRLFQFISCVVVFFSFVNMKLERALTNLFSVLCWMSLATREWIHNESIIR